MEKQRKEVGVTSKDNLGFHPCAKNTKGGEEIKPGTLHGGEEIKPGTLHGGGEEIKPGTLHETSPTNSKEGALPPSFSERIPNGKLYSNAVFLPEVSTSDAGCYMYNTEDAKAYYIFQYLKVDDEYKTQILSQPNYRSRSRALDLNFITIGEPDHIEFIQYPENVKINNLDTAKHMSKQWAEANWRYIKANETPTVQSINQETQELGEFILPSELFKRGLFLYPTSDCKSHFIYEYILKNPYYEIDVVSQPGYALENYSNHITHKLFSDTPHREKICLSAGHEPRDLETAKNISKEWAELTWEYIKSGKSIDEQITERSRSATNGNNSDSVSWLQRLASIFN